jgi:hypothetical protein
MTAADQSDQTVKNRLPRGRPHMANAVEAVGQDVHQKAADEFVYWQRHGLDPCAAGRLAAGAISFQRKVTLWSSEAMRRLFEIATRWV